MTLPTARGENSRQEEPVWANIPQTGNQRSANASANILTGRNQVDRFLTMLSTATMWQPATCACGPLS
jgi:hypothetical protein